MSDPIADLVAMLRRGEKPPLAWILEHAPDGDLTRVWHTCDDGNAMALFADRSDPIVDAACRRHELNAKGLAMFNHKHELAAWLRRRARPLALPVLMEMARAR